jgi:hypothetical protein
MTDFAVTERLPAASLFPLNQHYRRYCVTEKFRGGAMFNVCFRG